MKVGTYVQLLHDRFTDEALAALHGIVTSVVVTLGVLTTPVVVYVYWFNTGDTGLHMTEDLEPWMNREKP